MYNCHSQEKEVDRDNNSEALKEDSLEQQQPETPTHGNEAFKNELRTEQKVKVTEKPVTKARADLDTLANIGEQGDAQVVCPPCLCMMGDHQRDAYLLGSPTDHLLGTRANISQTKAQSTKVSSLSTTATTTTITTTASTTTTTTTTTSTTTTTTTTKATTTTPQTAPSPPQRASECDLKGELCLSESCVMAAGTILTSLDRR